MLNILTQKSENILKLNKTNKSYGINIKFLPSIEKKISFLNEDFEFT